MTTPEPRDRPELGRRTRRGLRLLVVLLILAPLVLLVRFVAFDDGTLRERGLFLEPVPDGVPTWNAWLAAESAVAGPYPRFTPPRGGAAVPVPLPDLDVFRAPDPDAEWVPLLRRYFDRHAEAWDRWLAAGDEERVWDPAEMSADGTLLVRLCTLIKYRAALFLLDGEPEEAYRTLDRARVLAETLWRARPTHPYATCAKELWSAAVYSACQLMECVPLPPDIEERWLRRAWVDEHAAELTEGVFAATYTFVIADFDFWLEGALHNGPEWRQKAWTCKRRRTRNSLAREFRRALPEALLSPHERPPEWDPAAGIDFDRRVYWHANSGETAVRAVLELLPGDVAIFCDQTLSDARIFRAVTALRAYERRTGVFPSSWDAVREELPQLDPLPLDPWSGEPFELDPAARTIRFAIDHHHGLKLEFRLDALDGSVVVPGGGR